jgi:Tol biopolymer transport system component
VQPADPFHVGYDALFTLDFDGTHLRQVNPPGGGLFPAWSPTDAVIAFSGPSADPRVDHIFVMASDGSGGARDLGVRGECARWSPDGKHIAYCSHNGDGNWAIWTVDADGSDARQLTSPTFRPPAGANGDYPVAWSPDGRQMLISSARDGARAMYVMDAAGSNVRRLLHGMKGVNSPSVWLPGGWIVFAHYAGENARPRWYAVRPDGSHLVRLSWLDGAGDPIDWSPKSSH